MNLTPHHSAINFLGVQFRAFWAFYFPTAFYFFSDEIPTLSNDSKTLSKDRITLSNDKKALSKETNPSLVCNPILKE